MITIPSLPDIELEATGGHSINLLKTDGKAVVLYFYPRDNTPGCTLEAQQFRDLHQEFVKVGAVIFGVSRDSLASHEKFKAKYSLPFELVADKDSALCNACGVIKQKTMYGKKVLGIERSTFVADATANVRREWRALKADGHAAEVLEFVRTLCY